MTAVLIRRFHYVVAYKMMTFGGKNDITEPAVDRSEKRDVDKLAKTAMSDDGWRTDRVISCVSLSVY